MLKYWRRCYLINYYERIQKAIDFIEHKLEENINLQLVAREAYMSLSNFYRMFFSLTGYTAKEYIRLRRMSKAVEDIYSSNNTLLDIALKYGFEDNTSFTKAFKRIVGVTPSVFKKQQLSWNFERMNILEKYYDIQDKELIEKYPDIKVLKNLEPIRVAYYCYFGKEPEKNAFNVMSDWLRERNFHMEKEKTRIFGFNNPSPLSHEQKEYGYEVWVTISEDIEVKHSLIKTKSFQGGLYAVTGVKDLILDGEGKAIIHAWKRFGKWFKDSKYEYGDNQWLEEHLKFDDEFNHIDGMDLYMPIKAKGAPM